MGEFLGGELKDEASAAAAARLREIDDSRYRALAESFRAPAEERTVSVTVSADQPLFPYGEEGGALRRLLRRCVRRCIRWYAEPLVQQQNRVNRALLAEIETLRRRIAELEEK